MVFETENLYLEPIDSEIASAAVLLQLHNVKVFVAVCQCVVYSYWFCKYVRRLFFPMVDMICPKYVRNALLTGHVPEELGRRGVRN